MVDIKLDNLSKKFNREIVFKELNYHFEQGQCYAITGSNGSGKSTLLKTITGFSLPSSGSVDYYINNQIIQPDDIYRYISIATPYMELIKSLTLVELLTYHSKFKAFRDKLTVKEVIRKMNLIEASNKMIKNFSSGMSQRLKLGLAFFSDASITFLDEPTTNLDKNGCEWYQNELNDIMNRLVLIASNQSEEYQLSQHRLKLNSFK
ncbi:MAG: ATP-binding cassette domain-containing protein [Bacteroidota bacterium]